MDDPARSKSQAASWAGAFIGAYLGCKLGDIVGTSIAVEPGSWIAMFVFGAILGTVGAGIMGLNRERPDQVSADEPGTGTKGQRAEQGIAAGRAASRTSEVPSSTGGPAC